MLCLGIALSATPALAQSGPSTANPIQDRDQLQLQDQTQQQLQDQDRDQLRTHQELNLFLEQRAQTMEQERSQLQETERNIYQKQDQVRIAVDALVATATVTNNNAEQIRQLAQSIGDSVQQSVQAEMRIQNRNWLQYLFAGGDQNSSQELKQITEQNRNRIQEMQQLWQSCDCDEQLRNTIQEQIRNMEQEQLRLQAIAATEQQRKGIFQYLFGWLKWSC